MIELILPTQRPGRATSLVGQRFGRWVVQSYAGLGSNKAYWYCLCDCGTSKAVQAGALKTGRSPSCGCKSREIRTTESYELRNRQYQADYRERNKPSRQEKLRQWRKDNPELVARSKRSTNYRIKYGLELEDVEKMFEEQEQACAICHKQLVLGGRAGAKVDHCHTTNKVRGILCSTCNTALGCFKDSPELLQQAIRYLEGEIGVAG